MIEQSSLFQRLGSWSNGASNEDSVPMEKVKFKA